MVLHKFLTYTWNMLQEISLMLHLFIFDVHARNGSVNRYRGSNQRKGKGKTTTIELDMNKQELPHQIQNARVLFNIL